MHARGRVGIPHRALCARIERRRLHSSEDVEDEAASHGADDETFRVLATADVGQALLARAREGLRVLEQGIGRVLSPDEIARMAKVGAELATLGVGLPTSRAALTAEDTEAAEALSNAKETLRVRLNEIAERQALANHLLASGPPEPGVVDVEVTVEDVAVEGPTTREVAERHDRQRQRALPVVVERIPGMIGGYDRPIEPAHRLR